MAEVPSPETRFRSGWTTTQVYVLAVLCFLLGLPTGYLFHGRPAVETKPDVSAAQPPAGIVGSQPTPEQMRRMADKTAEPLLAQRKTNPTDPALLAKVGNVYYDTQQYNEAIRYYSEALKFDLKNPNVRTDMATAYFYLGDTDRALAEINSSLQYDPKHPQSLLNLGMIKWQGKMDVDGAVAAWQKLLDTNPKFEQAEQVRQMIAQAKKHATIKSGSTSQKPI